MKNQETSADHGLNELIARTLRVGVAVSFALLLAGMLWTIALTVFGGAAPQPTARDPRSGALHPNVVLLLAGLIVLMMTPILRIVAALWSFTIAGDRRYQRISILVLATVLAGLALSLLQRVTLAAP